MPSRSLWSRPLAALGALFLTTCSSNSNSPSTTTGSTGLNNPTTASADIQSVDTAFKSPVLTSFTTLADQFVLPSAPVATLLRAVVPQGGGKPSYSTATAQLLTLRDGFAKGTLRFSIIPDSVRGRIYHLTSPTSGYVNSGETGGPSNGVRFVLYQTPLASPLDSIGYVNLLDESTVSKDSLEVQVIEGSTTYADYTISGSQSNTMDNLSLAGFVNDQHTLVNFTFTFNDNETTQVLSDQSTISAPSLNFNDTFKFNSTSSTSGSTTTTTVTLNYDLTDATDTITAQGTITTVQPGSGPSTTTGTITVSANGQSFATITATNTGETYNATNGNLSTAQTQALESMFASGIVLELIVILLIVPFAIV